MAADTHNAKEKLVSAVVFDARAQIWFRALNRICAIFVAVIGIVALLGWALELPFLASLGQGMIPVAPSTALFFVLYAAVVLLRTYFPTHRGTYWIGLSISSAGVLIALLLLFLSYKGIFVKAEHLGFTIVSMPGEIPKGHMSPLTALCFILASLSSLASLTSSPARPRRAAVAWWLACLLVLISLVLVLAYMYGEPLLYGGPFIPPALLTSMAFAALGTALLGLDGAQARLLSQPTELIAPSSYVFILIFIILAAGIITAGYLYYKHYVTNYRAEVQAQLSVIANLKVNGIMNWRKERLSDASLFYRNENFYDRVQRYFERPGDADAKERLLTWLRQLRETHQYDRICVLDVDGRPRISVPGGPGKVDPILSRAGAGLLRTGQITFEDFFRNENDGRIYLAVLVPVLDKDRGGLPLGVLVLHIDPEVYFYSLIKQWPAPSRTAEALLVRKEGNDVLFLNELRFKQNSALTLRRPLTQKALPAVQAVLGREGIVEGRDYRDVHVLANLRAVPGSPWFLVTKMDISEAYGPLNERLWIMIGFVVVLLLGSGAGVGLVWRQQSAFYYRQRCEAAEALRESEERFRLLVEGVRDYAIVMLDPSGNVMTWNQGAERIKGYREEEIIGRNFACFYPEEDLAQGKHLLALQKASSGGKSEEKGWRLRKDGSRFWASVLITALRDEAGQLRGFSKITRDISEQRLEQQEREITLEFLRLVNDEYRDTGPGPGGDYLLSAAIRMRGRRRPAA